MLSPGKVLYDDKTLTLLSARGLFLLVSFSHYPNMQDPSVSPVSTQVVPRVTSIQKQVSRTGLYRDEKLLVEKVV